MRRHVPGIVLLVFFLYAVIYLLPNLRAPRGNEGVAQGIPNPDRVYDPVETGKRLPDGFHQILGRDDIRPIYAPRFVSAHAAGHEDGTLVLGVALNGEAHAYPINVLNWREMIIDEVGGVPILATW